MQLSSALKKKLLVAATVVVVATAGIYMWQALRAKGPGDGFASGNGRIEAIEINVATKLAGRIDSIAVDEGDFVTAGQPLARMQTTVLEAQYDEAVSRAQEAAYAIDAAQSQVVLRKADVAAAQAGVTQREAELDAVRRRLSRSATLAREGASSEQELDDDRANFARAQATLAAARAQVASAQAAVDMAQAQLVGTRSSMTAAKATVARIEADITDSVLVAPRDGRVQFRIAQPGEVLPAGGKVLSLVDLSYVYMTFFLPETVAGRVAVGADARIVLDAAPSYVIPATISFVASTAQFTPKTVETASERQKLMFRVRAQIPASLLRKHVKQVKTGLPGVAWVKLDPAAAWPAELTVKVPE